MPTNCLLRADGCSTVATSRMDRSEKALCPPSHYSKRLDHQRRRQSRLHIPVAPHSWYDHEWVLCGRFAHWFHSEAERRIWVAEHSALAWSEQHQSAFASWLVCSTYLSYQIGVVFLSNIKVSLSRSSWRADSCAFSNANANPTHLLRSLRFRFANKSGRSARHERRNYKQQPRSLHQCEQQGK
jgi:hypothetical protein